jgi:hypothetical protein
MITESNVTSGFNDELWRHNLHLLEKYVVEKRTYYLLNIVKYQDHTFIIKNITISIIL